DFVRAPPPIGARPSAAGRTGAILSFVHALRIIADDLTGACDVGAEMLPWPAGVIVQPAAGGAGPAGALGVRNTQSRTLPPPEAARRVGGALADLRAGWSGIVLKKIDTGLRGPLGAEIDAAMDVLGVGEAFVLPAIPEVGRTTEQGCQMIGGVPVHRTAFARDPQNPIREASVAAAVAASGRRRAGGPGVLVVRGSAHPATRAQVECAAARRLIEPLVVDDPGAAAAAGLAAGGLLEAGGAVALVAPAEPVPAGSAGVLAALRSAALATLARTRPGGLVLIGG